MKLCGVNEVFDSKDFVYTLCLSTVLLCESLLYVEDDDDDENNETRAAHLI